MGDIEVDDIGGIGVREEGVKTGEWDEEAGWCCGVVDEGAEDDG
jgi:hypothetical protein